MQYRAVNWLYRPVVLLLLLILSALVFGMFLRTPGIIGDGRADFYNLVDGTAERPFAYRMFIPSTVRLLTSPISDETRASLAEWGLNNSVVYEVFYTSAWRIDWLPEFTAASVLMFAALLGFLWALRYFVTALYDGNRYWLDALLFLALLGLPPFFTATNYIYDLPALFLFTFCLALMVRRQWLPYLIVYVFACLNKETTILLTLIFAIHYFDSARMNRRDYLRWMAAQLAIFGVIRLLLMLTYADLPGGAVRLQIDFNLRLFTMQTYTLPEYLTWIGVVMLVLHRWREKPLFLRHSSVILIPLVGLMLVFGIITETRVFYEVYPIILLLAFYTVSRVLEFDLTPKLND